MGIHDDHDHGCQDDEHFDAVPVCLHERPPKPERPGPVCCMDRAYRAARAGRRLVPTERLQNALLRQTPQQRPLLRRSDRRIQQGRQGRHVAHGEQPGIRLAKDLAMGGRMSLARQAIPWDMASSRVRGSPSSSDAVTKTRAPANKAASSPSSRVAGEHHLPAGRRPAGPERSR